MKHKCPVALLTLLCAGGLYAQQPDARALFLKSIQNYDRDWRAGMQWGYTQTDVTVNGSSKTVEISEVMPLAGTPYERLTGKNGQQLSDEEKRKEDAKYEKALHQRQNETAEEHQARIRKYENERSFLKDLPNAYDVSLAGEDVVEGRPAWILNLKPRADFVPVTAHGAMLKHIVGRLWIDKEEVQWAKAEAHVVDTISIGWVVARIGPGAKITLDLTRVHEGLWMPKAIDIDGTAKVLMVHTKELNEHLTFHEYRKADGASGEAVAGTGPQQQVAGKSFR